MPTPTAGPTWSTLAFWNSPVSAHQERTSSDSNFTDRPFVAAIATGDDRWFRAVADNTYDWESWHRPDGRLVWVNPAVERMTGYSVAECLEMLDYPLPIVVPEDHASVTNVLASAQGKTSGEGLDFRTRNRHGPSRWMSLAWQPMYDADGTYLGYRTSARDVTERRALASSSVCTPSTWNNLFKNGLSACCNSKYVKGKWKSWLP